MKFSEKLAKFIVDARWYLFSFFILLTIASVIAIPYVGVNYDLTKYLPSDSTTKIAIDVMTDEFGSSGSASVMLDGITTDKLYLVEEVKGKIAEVDNVSTVVFDSSSESYYKDNKALLKVFFATGNYTQEVQQAIADIKAVCADYENNSYMAGEAVEATASQDSIGTEMYIILLVAIAIMLVILLLTSHSWFEPVIYIVVIGCSVLLNMGSNIILGEISFVTKSMSAIMLIALIMDYCIVLCSRFREELTKTPDPKQALTNALAGSFRAIIACSLTVMMGLLALVFMKFSIGFDMGMVLAKGVAISILTVLFFMPSIILLFSKPLQKTQHKSLLPKMDKVGTFASKTKWIMPIIFVCLVTAGIVIQQNINFSYVATNVTPTSVVGQEEARIEQTFGKQNSLVIMVPKGNYEAEKSLLDEVSNIEIDGTKYISSASGIASTSLCVKGTYTQLAPVLGMDDYLLRKLYIQMGKSATDEAYIIDVITYIYTDLNSEDSKIKKMLTSSQQTLNSTYADYASTGVYEISNYSQAVDKFASLDMTFDETTMKAIFANILSKSPDDVTENDVLPNYALFYAVYNMEGITPSQKLENIVKVTFSNLMYAPLSYEQYINLFEVPSAILQSIFTKLNKDYTQDTLFQLEFVAGMCAKTDNLTPLEQYLQAMQAKITTSYSQVALATSMYVGPNYSRLIFNMNLVSTDDKAVSVLEQVNNILNSTKYTSIYEKTYLVGNTQNFVETKEIFSTDRIRIDLITVLGVFLLILLMFRSISIPILLVLTIQGAIWINLAIGSLVGQEIFFICYLLAMAIQMGATIDYGILLTDRYIGFRKTMGKTEAIKKALNASFPTIITSGSILIVAAYTIHFISSTPILIEVGSLIGRGALISVIAILFVLPQLLLLFDKVIEKTTLRQHYFNEKAVVGFKKTDAKVEKEVVEGNAEVVKETTPQSLPSQTEPSKVTFDETVKEKQVDTKKLSNKQKYNKRVAKRKNSKNSKK